MIQPTDKGRQSTVGTGSPTDSSRRDLRRTREPSRPTIGQFGSDSGSGIAIASALMVGVGLRGAETSESRSPSSGPLADATFGPRAIAVSGLIKIGPWSGHSYVRTSL